MQCLIVKVRVRVIFQKALASSRNDLVISVKFWLLEKKITVGTLKIFLKKD